ncbi:GroES-like protein [Trametes gibbosa]|nr:GroES-like protein [Trametes gibbosa]
MTIPVTQKALLLLKEGTPYVVGERPVPRPGPGEVLVKIVTCALNPVDYAIVDPPLSRVLIANWPHVPGYDAAGVVIELGAGVSSLKEGDKVIFQGSMTADGAACQQYATVSASLTSIVRRPFCIVITRDNEPAQQIPDNITFEQAATLPLALFTAAMSLYNQSSLPDNLSLRAQPIWKAEGRNAYAGTPAFIIAGAASVGQFAIQFARIAGHNPIITTASLHNAPLLKSLGATHVLDRALSNEAILAELFAVVAGKPLAYVVVAMIDPETLRLGRDAVAPGGTIVTMAPSPQSGHIPEDVANPGNGKRIAYTTGSVSAPFTRDTCVEIFKHLTGWLENGDIKPNPVEILPNGLAGINDGLARMKAKKVSGTKLVALPQETL